MRQLNDGRSYDHKITRYGPDQYVIGWSIDFYYQGVRQRFPRRFTRHANAQNARRFARKWGLAMPTAGGS